MRREFFRCGVVVLAIVGALGAGYVQADIVNGNFETSPYDVGNNVPGWTYTGFADYSGIVASMYNGHAPLSRFGTNGMPSTEDHVLRLGVTESSWMPAGNLLWCQASQTVTGLTPGQYYNLTFEQNRDGYSVMPLSWSVSTESTQIAAGTATSSVEAAGSYTRPYNSITTSAFRATDSSMAISFYISLNARGGQNQDHAFYVDNVTLHETVPEPGTLGAMLSGIVGFLAYAWRKRR